MTAGYGILKKIDIHSDEIRYEKALESLKKDKSIGSLNKAHVLRFLNDCQIGKTVLRRAKKRIKTNRLIKYLFTLRQIARHLKKDFKRILGLGLNLCNLEVREERRKKSKRKKALVCV